MFFIRFLFLAFALGGLIPPQAPKPRTSIFLPNSTWPLPSQVKKIKMKVNFDPKLNREPKKAFKAFETSHKEKPNLIVKFSNCSNVSRSDLALISQVYPHVLVNCELQQSTLIPKELADYPHAQYEFVMFRNKMTFTEFVTVTESKNPVWRQPVANCVKSGVGLFETLVNLLLLMRMAGGVAKGFTFFVKGLTSSGSLSLLGEWTYSVACNHNAAAVRPVAEISTATVTERVRTWDVDLAAPEYLKLGEWSDMDRVKVYPDSIVLSCVLEQQVAGVCGWTEASVQNELEKSLFGDQ